MQDMAPRNITSRWLILGAVVLLAAIAAVLGWQLGRVGLAPAPSAVSPYPPLLTEFRLPSLEGRQLGPGDFAGRAVLVEFWATWCGPCHVQAKILAALYEDLKDQDVQFLAVSVGEDPATVKEFVAERPFAYPVLLDEHSRVADAARIYSLPTLLVVDRSGAVVFLQSGLTPRRTLETILDQALEARSWERPAERVGGWASAPELRSSTSRARRPPDHPSLRRREGCCLGALGGST